MSARLFWPIFLAIMAVAALGGVLPSYYAGLLIEALVFAVFALGLNLLMGYAGLPSLGHAAYFAAGAYGAALVAIHLTKSFWVGALAGIGAGTLLGAAFGLLALRAKGVYFLMITLALAQIAWAIAFSWRAVTGGDDGLRGIGRPDLGLGIDLSGTGGYYWFALVMTGIVFLLMRALLRSPFGLTLPGIQDSADRMDALGYNVWLHKYIAFVLSAAVTGFAGVLFVYYKGFISPEAASIVMSAEVMLMVILGGAGTLVGPVVGAFVIILLSNIVSGHTARWTMILGVLYVAVVLLAPAGVTGTIRNVLAGRRPAS